MAHACAELIPRAGYLELRCGVVSGVPIETGPDYLDKFCRELLSRLSSDEMLAARRRPGGLRGLFGGRPLGLGPWPAHLSGQRDSRTRHALMEAGAAEAPEAPKTLYRLS